MNVLYVVGACLTKNTSANMSHNAYVQGLLENGCQVDILMASDSWGEEDKALPRWESAHYYEYHSVSFSEYLRRKAAKSVPAPVPAVSASTSPADCSRLSARQIVKKLFYILFPKDPIYPLEHKWLKKASHFRGSREYDLVISNSSPAASHKLVSLLKDKKRISFQRWVQIWEDPWYYDLYGGHSLAEKEEEHALLQQASEIYYVSPLTLNYQKQYFADCAARMHCIPLPFLDFSGAQNPQPAECSFGYFGDYYSKTRNLKPFYEALCQSGCKGSICGDSDLCLASTEQITVSGRVTLDRLAVIQDNTSVLVHLCNLKGGQIPGKIYHYSATNKPILFILDGTPEEKETIRSFFQQFNRYYFCENTPDQILKAIRALSNNKSSCSAVDAFAPRNVVARLLAADTAEKR